MTQHINKTDLINDISDINPSSVETFLPSLFLPEFLISPVVFFTGIMPLLKQNAGVKRNSGILCLFHWIKVSFNLCFAFYKYIYVYTRVGQE